MFSIICNCSEAPTKEEYCKVPRKTFLKMGLAPDPDLTSSMYKNCMKSSHPNIHICKKAPETDFAKKTHKVMKAFLRKMKKKRKKGRGKGRKKGGNRRKRKNKGRKMKRNNKKSGKRPTKKFT